MVARARQAATLDPTFSEHSYVSHTGRGLPTATLTVTADVALVEAYKDAAEAAALAAEADRLATVAAQAAAAASAAAALASEIAAELAESNIAASLAAKANLAGATFTGDAGVTKAAGDSLLWSFGATSGKIRLGDTGAGGNLKYHDIVADGGVLAFRHLNDALTTKETVLSFAADGSATFSDPATFGGNVTVSKTGDAMISSVGTSGSILRLADTSQAANQKYWDVRVDGGVFSILRLNDALTTAETPFTIDASGALTYADTVTVTGASVAIENNDPSFQLYDTNGTADKRKVRLDYSNNRARMRSYNDAGTALRSIVEFVHDGGLLITSWTTAGRPTGEEGLIGYNTDTDQFEGYANGAWGSLGGGATGASGDMVFMLNEQTVTASYTIPTGFNAVSAGPVEIATGVTVEVPTGSVWTVV